MDNKPIQAYAELCGSKSDPQDRERFYQIYFGEPLPNNWKGPYRDKVDAENAAEDEARRSGLELNWR